MSKRIITAAVGVCLAAIAMTTSAQARLDHGPISSMYDEDGRSSAKSAKSYKSAKSQRSARYNKSGKNRVAKYKKGKSYASKARPSLSSRAVTASAGDGGGAGRGCLQPQARALLSRIEAQFGAVQLISTCRPGAVIAGSGKPSKHRYGLAIDFNAGGRKGAIVQWLIANHHSGGTMTYSGMNHIHVDIGPRFVSLGSRSRG
jgi:uncharacterized protein YcbK (DUF882 family)